MRQNQEETEDIIDLGVLLKALLRRWWVILLTTVLCGGMALIGSILLIAPTYSSGFTAYIDNSKERVTDSISSTDISASKELVSTYSAIIRSRSVVEDAIQKANISCTYEYMEDKVIVQEVDDTGIIEVSVVTEDSKMSYEMAKAQVETAQGNLSDSKIRLGYANVVAPVSGYTSRANYTEGNLITTADANPLTVVNQVNPIHVTFSIPATTMSSIRLLASEGRVTIADNLTSTLYFGDGVKYPEQGNIIFFDKMITSATGDIKAKAEFPNPYMAVLPGQYVRATLDGYTFVNAIIIPQKAVIQRQGQQMVIVVDEQNIAHFKPVELGMNLGNKFLVTKGLQAGDRIIIEGTNKVMRDGSPVMDKAQMMQMMQQRMQSQAANKPQSQNTQQTQGGNNNSQSQQSK